MRIDEALRHLFDGKKITHESWNKYVYYCDTDLTYYKCNNDALDNDEEYSFILDEQNIEGWELYKPPHGIYQCGNDLIFYNGKFRQFQYTCWEWIEIFMDEKDLDAYELKYETDNIDWYRVSFTVIPKEIEIS